MGEVLGHPWPVDARVAPPVTCTRLLVVAKVWMEAREVLAHGARLSHRHVGVGVAVEYVDPAVDEIGLHQRSTRDVRGTGQHRFHGTGILERACTGVGPEVLPAGARSDRGEPASEHRPEDPRAVAPHGVTREVGAARVRAESSCGVGPDFERVHPPPVLPVKTELPAVRGSDDVLVRARCEAGGLSRGLDPRAVEGEGQGWRARHLLRADRRRDRVVLHAAIDLAAKRAPVLLVPGLGGEWHRELALDRLAARELQLHFDVSGGIGLPADLHRDFVLRARSDRRNARSHRLRTLTGGDQHESLLPAVRRVGQEHPQPDRLVLAEDQVGCGEVAHFEEQWRRCGLE